MYFIIGAPYEVFGGKDISRALAKFSLETSQEYDDLSDLKTGEMESIREWEEQFKGNYLTYIFSIKNI